MKTLIAAAGMVAATLLAASGADAAPSLTFTPSATHLDVGGTVTIDVGVSGLDAEIVRGFDLDFVYDPAVLSWDAIGQSFGSQFTDNVALGTNGLPEGDLGLNLVTPADDATIAAQQENSFQLFQFVLVGRADGATRFTLGTDPATERLFRGLADKPLDLRVDHLCIAVGNGRCDVPEPATYGLVALAVAASLVPGALRRRRDRLEERQ